MSYPGNESYNIAIRDGANLDPFSRLRASIPQLRLSAYFDYDKRPLYWAEKTSGGASAAVFNSDSRCVEMTLGTASGQSIIRQTKEYFNYRAGQGQQILTTFTFNPAKANLRQRVGYFDANNGVFLEQNGNNALAIVLRSKVTGSVLENSIPQSTWNVDPMDGTGPSGIILDISTRQILIIDLQWLAVGRVRVGFDIDGQIYYVHHFEHANQAGETLPYMQTACLPVRYEIENTGVTATASTLRQICTAVNREGAENNPTTERAFSTVATGTQPTATTTLRTLLGIRLNSSNIRSTLRIANIELNNLNTSSATWWLILNPGGTGAASWLTPPANANSIAQYSRSQVSVTVDANGYPSSANAVVMDMGFSPGNQANRGATESQKIIDSLPVAADIDGVSDELWLCVQTPSGSTDIQGAMSVQEIR